MTRSQFTHSLRLRLLILLLLLLFPLLFPLLLLLLLPLMLLLRSAPLPLQLLFRKLLSLPACTFARSKLLQQTATLSKSARNSFTSLMLLISILFLFTSLSSSYNTLVRLYKKKEPSGKPDMYSLLDASCSRWRQTLFINLSVFDKQAKEMLNLLLFCSLNKYSL